MGVRRDADRDGDLAGARTSLSLLGYLAADDEHGGLAADVSRRVPAAEQPEPRHAGVQLKLDELLRTTSGARPQLINLEELDEEQLQALTREFERLRERRSRTPETK